MCSRGKECSLERSNSRGGVGSSVRELLSGESGSVPRGRPLFRGQDGGESRKRLSRGPSAGVPRRAKEVMHSHKS